MFPPIRRRPSAINLGGILLITPESLESNFINFGAQVPRVYRHLSFVVIDELHSFLSNVRGVHLQSLLSRLVVAAGCRPRLVGLSATLADPQAARTFLAPDSVESVQVIEDTAVKREIKFGIKSFLAWPKHSKQSSGGSRRRRLWPSSTRWESEGSRRCGARRVTPATLHADIDSELPKLRTSWMRSPTT